MLIRTATIEDLDAIARVEAICFPPAEAATREEFAQRLLHYADHFWLLFEGEELVSFVDGFVSDEEELTDEMFENAGLHREAGSYQMIFGVNTLPAFRGRGYATRLLQQVIADAKRDGRQAVILTCKEALLGFYERLGFEKEALSSSTHGGAVWYQMRRDL